MSRMRDAMRQADPTHILNDYEAEDPLERLAELPTGQWYLIGVESEEQLPPQGHHYSDQLHCFVKHYFIEEDRISFMVWVELA